MTTDLQDIAAGGHLTIDLAAVVANWRLLSSRLLSGVAAAVVKADAYGLGAARVAPSLEAAGCEDFFVAHLSEALELKRHLQNGSRLYVLNGLQPGAEVPCAEAGVIPVLNSLEQAQRWRKMATLFDRTLPAALQVDTGMNRLGLSPPEVDQLVADPDFFRDTPLALLMSHLACSDEPGAAANAHQLRTFNAVAARLPKARRSLANSGGVFLEEAFHGDLARPGVALYGAAANGARPNPMQPVIRLDARVVQVRDIEAGQGVGYGLTFARSEAGRIATIAVGYADGWPRQLSNVGAAYYQGLRLPIAGRVSMDSITLDVSVLAAMGLNLRLGDEVELLGPNQTLEDVARDAGTIPYEILTSLGHRYSRTYLSGEDGPERSHEALETAAS